MAPADFETAFISITNWTWHNDTTGPAASPIMTATSEHDLRECWLVLTSDPSQGWVIIYDADYGSTDGDLALGYTQLPSPTAVSLQSFSARRSTYPILQIGLLGMALSGGILAWWLRRAH